VRFFHQTTIVPRGMDSGSAALDRVAVGC